MMNCWSF